MTAPTTQAEAVTLALCLALTAPNDRLAASVAGTAEALAAGLTARQVGQCKRKALRMARQGGVDL